MENKEMKKTIPVELEEDALDSVSGGAVGRVIPRANDSMLDSDVIKDEIMLIIPTA